MATANKCCNKSPKLYQRKKDKDEVVSIVCTMCGKSTSDYSYTGGFKLALTEWNKLSDNVPTSKKAPKIKGKKHLT